MKQSFNQRGGVRAFFAVSALVMSAGLAMAQAPAATGPTDKDRREAEVALKDFIHYTIIDRYDLAKSFGQAVLDKGFTARDLMKLIEDSGEMARFEKATSKAQRVPELEGVAGKLMVGYEQGKLDQARNPEEIAKNISLLTKEQRARILGRERLAGAGEYAVPQLLQALQKKDDPALKAEVWSLLVDMGRQSVMPLCAALPQVEPVVQESICGVLGEVPYRASIPFLVDLHGATKLDTVKAAAERAVVKIAGTWDAAANVSQLYGWLGDQYYAESQSLTSFAGEPMQLVWDYNPSVGLVATPVRTEVFHEMMAMRMGEKALKASGGNENALSLWLAANFRREIQSPAEYKNPLYGSDRREAMYYAVAAGPAASERVLARAIDDKDTALARRAIAAIERTAGNTSLFAKADRRPLLDALGYPSRRVQYEAALAIAKAQPSESFGGSERVVPILGSAIRDAAAKYAVVLSAGAEGKSGERQNVLAQLLRANGYTVVAQAADLAGAEQAILEAPGVDLVVIDYSKRPADVTDKAISDIHGRTRMAATPVLAFLGSQAMADLNAKYGRMATIRLVGEGLNDAQITEAAKQLSESAGGSAVTPEEAKDYQVRALAALRDLAVSGSTVLNVADAGGPLVTSLGQSKGDLRMQVAEVLSRVNDKKAQLALMDAALAAEAEEQVGLLGKTAESAKRYGNLLEERQVKRAVEMAQKGADAQALAAAALLGALNLPNDNLIPLIVGK